MKSHLIMNGIKKLIVLANKFAQSNQEDTKERNQYGGFEFELPPDHKAMLVIKSGSFSCANCKYVNAEKHTCGNEYYQKWNGSDKLPDAPLDKICSDFFEPKSE